MEIEANKDEKMNLKEMKRMHMDKRNDKEASLLWLKWQKDKFNGCMEPAVPAMGSLDNWLCWDSAANVCSASSP